MKYAYFGDPAAELKYADAGVKIDSINSQSATTSNIAQLEAGNVVSFTGHIGTSTSLEQTDTAFTGTLYATLLPRYKKSPAKARATAAPSHRSPTPTTPKYCSKAAYLSTTGSSPSRQAYRAVPPSAPPHRFCRSMQSVPTSNRNCAGNSANSTSARVLPTKVPTASHPKCSYISTILTSPTEGALAPKPHSMPLLPTRAAYP